MGDGFFHFPGFFHASSKRQSVKRFRPLWFGNEARLLPALWKSIVRNLCSPAVNSGQLFLPSSWENGSCCSGCQWA